MASLTRNVFVVLTFLCVLLSFVCFSNAQLSTNFYGSSCRNVAVIVRNAMRQAVSREQRLGASILRLFFHDCFVNVGGPTWTVPLGRRDARTASQSAANTQIPAPTSSLSTLISMFSAKGLSAADMTALSGSHTIGQARCTTFRTHIYNETNIDTQFAATRRATCPASGGDANLAPLDIQTPNRFNNDYYENLVARRGLLHSDQELFNGGSQDALVRSYSTNAVAFRRDFAAAMVKMGNISPLTGTNGEIRRNCRAIN
ncbi:peroxidase-like isoform X2 [Lycium ferocissimum]|uniref:peroxidase-like isoform X2 n=1 Tax=Lycium ferocissimum TaxID=112874 RepID=UPI0028149C43|nr:peroxidase-like isoform X2 [Lycium ferocissimum]